MNRRHLAAILWLRWRISLHQLSRAGIANTLVLVLVGLSVASASVGFFFLGIFGGFAAASNLSPEVLLLIWDGVAGIFLLFWLIGLMAELQRSEVLSLQKLMHLPVSPNGAFVLNYVGSLMSTSLALVGPGMLGLSIGLVMAKGIVALPIFATLAGFLFMVTALTYQFQGWLAALMVNKRRRRTLIALMTFGIVIMGQLPNLVNGVFRFRRDRPNAVETQSGEDVAPSLSPAEASRRRQERREHAFGIARQVNAVLPVGWLPYGVMSCAQGNPLPALLGALGTSLIGVASLRRSYRTTLRLYSGHFTSVPGLPTQAAPRATASGQPDSRGAPTEGRPLPKAEAILLERELPLVTEHTAAVALASLRSLLRAPEAKMALMMPVILLFIAASAMLTNRAAPPAAARPFLGLAAIGIVFLTLLQLAGNQFGFDRDGFRALVLSPAPRRDILLGKNLALAPFALGIGLALLGVTQIVFPMRIDHLLATVAELGSAFLLFCLVANLTSILAPVPMASGSLRPARPKLGTVLLQLGIMFLLPVLIAFSIVPLGLEMLLRHWGFLPNAVPLYLICSIPELALVLWLYGRAIGWEGRLLQAREQRILVAVTTKVE